MSTAISVLLEEHIDVAADLASLSNSIYSSMTVSGSVGREWAGAMNILTKELSRHVEAMNAFSADIGTVATDDVSVYKNFLLLTPENQKCVIERIEAMIAAQEIEEGVDDHVERH